MTFTVVLSEHITIINQIKSQLKMQNNLFVSMLFLRGHVPHQVVDKLLALFDILSGLRLVLETDHIVRHLEDQTALGVVVLGGVAHLHGVLQVQSLCCRLKLLPAVQECHAGCQSEIIQLSEVLASTGGGR